MNTLSDYREKIGGTDSLEKGGGICCTGNQGDGERSGSCIVRDT